MIFSKPAPFFQGHISLEETKGGIKPWRLPVEKRAFFPSPDDSLMTRSEKASGVRLAFLTDGNRICLTYEAVCEDPAYAFDLTQNGKILETVYCSHDPGEKTIILFLKGRKEEPYYLWLPQFCDIIVKSIEILGGTFLTIPRDTRPKWLTYGSSITHCRQADSPAQTWPAVAARKCNLNLTAMGFGGQCHFDGMVGRVIRDQVSDIITLKLGINVYGGGSLNKRTYQPALINLIKTIREGQPLTPLGIISPIYSCEREEGLNLHCDSLQDYRIWNKNVVEIFQKSGDDHIFYFNGLGLLDQEDASLLPDNLHPDNQGYQLMGERAAQQILPVLLENRV